MTLPVRAHRVTTLPIAAPPGSAANGNHTFFANFRWGLGSQVSQPLGTDGTVASPATVLTALNLTGNPVPGASAPNIPASPGPTIQLLGPGDVTTLDSGQVVRTEPKDGTSNFEPNYFAAIEFVDPSFPWIFSPAGPTEGPQGSTPGPAGYPSGGAIPPWVVLIVLAQSEFDDLGNGPVLPSINVHSASTLPNLLESWAWAHTHVIGGVETTDDSGLQSIFSSAPQKVISRLLCPRVLSAQTQYTAFLVPAFDIGLKAGLGTLPNPMPTSAGPAWPVGATASIQLPYFYRFSFATGASGDFESLVRALQIRSVAGLGFRPIDVSDPGPSSWGVGPASNSGSLLLPGAMHTAVPESQPAWPDAQGQTFQTQLSQLLGTGNPPPLVTSGKISISNHYSSDPTLAPPVYGCWYAGVASVLPPPATTGAPPAPPLWMQTVNYDPRWRAIAGLGAAVVQSESNQLMAGAWAQYPGLFETNQLLRQAQLARAGLTSVLAKHVASLPAQSQLAVGAPLLSKLMTGGTNSTTFFANVAQSTLPPALLASTVRRAMRLFGPSRVRPLLTSGNSYATYQPSAWVAAVNSGAIGLVLSYTAPIGFNSMEQMTAKLGYGPALDTAALTERFGGSDLATRSSVVLLTPNTFASVPPRPNFALPSGLKPVSSLTAVGSAPRQAAAAAPPPSPSPTPAPRLVKASPPVSPSAATVPVGTVARTLKTTGSGDSSDANQYRVASEQVATLVNSITYTPPPLQPVDFGSVTSSFGAALDPDTTVPARVRSRFPSTFPLSWNTKDPIEPVMAAPQFPNPMYLAMLGLSEQYLCPGLENLPPDTLTILAPDSQVVEAFMLGLNQEMARLLLWNRYPTDLRGTYFQQFWDPAVQLAGLAAAGTSSPQPNYDILPIAGTPGWGPKNDLGDNAPSGSGGPGLFLVVRGELFRRYPNTLVYMTPAQTNTPGQSPALVLPTPVQPMWPLFQGILPPDLTFFAFAPTPQEAAGGTNVTPSSGYLFVFQQAHAELRFGLEPTAGVPSGAPESSSNVTWADLSWQNFASAAFASPNASPFLYNAGQLTTTPYQPTTSPDSGYSWGTDAASMAYITLRPPNIVAITGSDLLGLPGPPPPTWSGPIPPIARNPGRIQPVLNR